MLNLSDFIYTSSMNIFFISFLSYKSIIYLDSHRYLYLDYDSWYEYKISY